MAGGAVVGVDRRALGGVGTSMQRIFTESARASYRALSEQMLAPFERDLRRLPGFVQAIFRTTLDELTKQLVPRPLPGNPSALPQPGGAGEAADITNW